LKIKLLLPLSLALLVCACITYRDFPEAMVNKPPQAKPYDTLYYTMPPFNVLSVGSGEDTMRMVFGQKTPFATTEKVDAVPKRGVHCNVEVLYKTPSVPAFVFGYISVGTLTILPFWSERDGYRITYKVSVDGQEKRSFEYDITRKAGVWILMLPFAWVNAFTYSEAEAFEATAYQFFKDADSLFAAYKK